MLIDNEKFIGLLVENSGIEKEKVEKYLEELVNDIKTAFEEGEGYEVEGFGIFSKLGSNVLFIPSEELETEINYKYVGMEPIEMPGGAPEDKNEDLEEEEENPIQGILDGDIQEEYEDPFAELFAEVEGEKENSPSEEKEASEDEDIEAAVQEEIENEDQEEDVLEEIIEEQSEADDELAAVDDIIEESEIVGTEELEGSGPNKDQESEEPEDAPGPDKWGIDAHKEDDQEDAFSGLLGEEDGESSELIDEEDIFASDEEAENSEESKEDEIDFSALENDPSDEFEQNDFDDPFIDLEEEPEDDFVPVVTNVSSDIIKEEEPEDSKNEEKKKIKTPKSPRERKQGSPVFLYLILALVVLAGSGYLLAYFGIINIKGITPATESQVAQQTTQPITEAEPPQVNQQDLVETEDEVASIENAKEANNDISNSANTIENNEAANPTEERERDLAPIVADEKAPGNGGIITPVNTESNSEPYGLRGSVSEAGNNGYTIVLYTLSKKAGADTQFEKLTQDGYRVIIKENPSDTYGVLYRVSIGQFESLSKAAIAAEKIDPDILGNYIITKI